MLACRKNRNNMTTEIPTQIFGTKNFNCTVTILFLEHDYALVQGIISKTHDSVNVPHMNLTRSSSKSLFMYSISSWFEMLLQSRDHCGLFDYGGFLDACSLGNNVLSSF